MPKNRKQKIPKSLKNKVWDKYIGQKYGTGDCQSCYGIIDSKYFECGHVRAEAKGGKLNLSNLRPICGLCNRSMGTLNLKEYQQKCGYRKNYIATRMNKWFVWFLSTLLFLIIHSLIIVMLYNLVYNKYFVSIIHNKINDIIQIIYLRLDNYKLTELF